MTDIPPQKEEFGPRRLLWGLFCTLVGGTVGAYFGWPGGPVATGVLLVLGMTGGVLFAFNPLSWLNLLS